MGLNLFKNGKNQVIVFLRFNMICIVLGIFISGCIPQKNIYIKENVPHLTERLNQNINQLYPGNLKAVHHVILTVLGKDYVLNGYLTVNREKKELSLIAQNDLGGTVFALNFIQDTKKEINIKVNMLKKAWLEKSALQDLKNLYLAEPFSSPSLSIDKNNNMILFETDNKITREYIYKKTNEHKSGYQLIGIKHLKNHKCFYSINFHYNCHGQTWSFTSACPQQSMKVAVGYRDFHINNDKYYTYPKFILIKNNEMHYILKIKVQYFMN